MKTKATIILVVILLCGFVGELLYFSIVPKKTLGSEKATTFVVQDKILEQPVAANTEPAVYISEEVVEVCDDFEEQTEVAYEEDYAICDYISYDSDSCLTRDAGVNYYGGRTETWYSSNLLYHYMTPEWALGDDGVYRDSDGYVVVACTDISYGEIVDTSLGVGKVYDCGCAVGVTDIYTNW